MRANTLVASHRYFETMGMSLIRGRLFEATDDAASPPVMIINETFAATYLPDEDPIGRRIISGFDKALGSAVMGRDIVGVINDTRDRGLDRAPVATIYLPYQQGTLPYGAVALHAKIAPSGLVAEIRRRLGAINIDVPVVEFQTLDQRIRDSLREPRFYTFLALMCSAIAVLFVGIGLYGVVAYAVSRRTQELGIRMALGSSPASILRLMLRQGTVIVSIGAALGVSLALVSMRSLGSMLFEVDPLDPPTLTASVLFVVVVALLATFVPAWRASRLSPVTALRYEE
jgi:hypothetical protein